MVLPDATTNEMTAGSASFPDTMIYPEPPYHLAHLVEYRLLLYVTDKDFLGKKGHYLLRAVWMIDELVYTSGSELSQEKSRHSWPDMLEYLQR